MKTIECDYANNGETITASGKFEGQPVFVPHYWNLALEGFADRDDGKNYTFRFAFATTDADCAFRPQLEKWLGRRRTLTLSEDSQGFVSAR